MGDPKAEILGIGMITSVGSDAPKTAAAVRAGLSRFRESSFQNAQGKPIYLATVPAEDLAPLHSSIAGEATLSLRVAHMLKLGAVALREALVDVPDTHRIPLLLALPETLPTQTTRTYSDFLPNLAIQSDIRFDVEKSKVFPGGRAAAMTLLDEACDRLASGAAPCVLVGGVDSHQDPELLAKLGAEDRLRGEGVLDGFTPGEGSAFLLLGAPGSARKRNRDPLAMIDAFAAERELGHRYSTEPDRGEGLTATFRMLFDQMSSPIRTVFAGFNGESFNAKEWTVAYTRHQEHFEPGFRFLHPADCLGDTGAAMAPIMMALAAISMDQRYRRSPSLIWCSSELDLRGAAVLRACRP